MLLQKKVLQKKALQKKALDFCLENQSCDRRHNTYDPPLKLKKFITEEAAKKMGP